MMRRRLREALFKEIKECCDWWTQLLSFFLFSVLSSGMG